MNFASAFLSIACAIPLSLLSQVNIDKPVQLTGEPGERAITNLELPVNATDAANKEYVDSAVSAGGGGSVTMITDESAATYNLGDAIRYCRNLTESGHSDWKLPTLNEILNVISKGGTTIANESSSNYILFQPFDAGGSSVAYFGWTMFRLSDGSVNYFDIRSPQAYRVRCVR